MLSRIATKAGADRVLAEMSPDDTAAALRLLKVLEECRQMNPAEAEDWRRRIEGWARFNAVQTWAAASSQGGEPFTSAAFSVRPGDPCSHRRRSLSPPPALVPMLRASSVNCDAA